MLLPNHENAIVDIAKLTDYSLNENHPVGKHKAFLFRKLLGLTVRDAGALQDIIFERISSCEAVFQREDDFGKRYCVDFILEFRINEVWVRTVWIILTEEDFPRLATCFIKP